MQRETLKAKTLELIDQVGWNFSMAVFTLTDHISLFLYVVFTFTTCCFDKKKQKNK